MSILSAILKVTFIILMLLIIFSIFYGCKRKFVVVNDDTQGNREIFCKKMGITGEKCSDFISKFFVTSGGKLDDEPYVVTTDTVPKNTIKVTSSLNYKTAVTEEGNVWVLNDGDWVESGIPRGVVKKVITFHGHNNQLILDQKGYLYDASSNREKPIINKKISDAAFGSRNNLWAIDEQSNLIKIDIIGGKYSNNGKARHVSANSSKTVVLGMDNSVKISNAGSWELINVPENSPEFTKVHIDKNNKLYFETI
jgi:hypothetical protein